MKQPAGLNAAGKAAWKRAKLAVEQAPEPDQLYDLAARYAYAVDRGDRARRQWRKEGEPMTLTSDNGVTGVHPLLKVMDDADKLAHRFGQTLKLEPPARKPGPRPSAVPGSQTLGKSPAAKLRAVA